MRVYPDRVIAEIGKHSRPISPIHLLDVQRPDGSTFYWSNFAGSFPGRLGVQLPPRVVKSLRLQNDQWLGQPFTMEMSNDQGNYLVAFGRAQAGVGGVGISDTALNVWTDIFRDDTPSWPFPAMCMAGMYTKCKAFAGNVLTWTPVNFHHDFFLYEVRDAVSIVTGGATGTGNNPTLSLGGLTISALTNAGNHWQIAGACFTGVNGQKLWLVFINSDAFVPGWTMPFGWDFTSQTNMGDYVLSFTDDTASEVIYKPWISQAPTITLSRSLTSDGGQVKLQNVSGNSIERDVLSLLKANEFEGALAIYRRWLIRERFATIEFHGYLSHDPPSNGDEMAFRMSQLFTPGDYQVAEFTETQDCHFRFGSAQCGMRRGSVMIPLTTADAFSANTIGFSGLQLTPNYFKGEVVMILAGTGAGQEGYVASNDGTTFTMRANWGTAPDATSKFVVTGPGTMIVGATTADIFSANTIGKTTLTRTVNAEADQKVAIISGTGAGQARRILSNTATTYTVAKNWTTVPDATSVFVVVYRTCPKDKNSCSDRGVLERYPGLLTLTPLVTNLVSPSSAAPGAAPASVGGAADLPQSEMMTF